MAAGSVLILVVYVWQKLLALALKRPSLSSFRQLSPWHTGGAVTSGGEEVVFVEVEAGDVYIKQVQAELTCDGES
jgi:hypothetical protein